MVCIALIAAVSRMYIWVRLYLGTAMVMMIRMIAITINNSIREKPRRRLWLAIGMHLYVMTSVRSRAWNESVRILSFLGSAFTKNQGLTEKKTKGSFRFSQDARSSRR